MTTKSERQRENTESRRLVEAAFELARSLEITTLLVQADELQDVRLIERARNSERVIWLTRSGEFSAKSARDDAAIRLPETTLTRISQMKLGLLLAVLDGEVELSDSILGVSGVAGSRRSGSSGTVTLFRGGEAILEFEKPTPRPQTAG